MVSGKLCPKLLENINLGSSMNKRKTTLFGPILGQYYLDRHSISNTNILKITGLVKYCPIFVRLNVVISLVCETVSCVKVQVVAYWSVRPLRQHIIIV